MRPVPAAMRDQDTFEPLGPPIRTSLCTPAEMQAVQREADNYYFECGDNSGAAPHAVWDADRQCWVHKDQLQPSPRKDAIKTGLALNQAHAERLMQLMFTLNRAERPAEQDNHEKAVREIIDEAARDFRRMFAPR